MKGFDARVALARERDLKMRRRQLAAIGLTVILAIAFALFMLAKQLVVEFEDGEVSPHASTVKSGAAMILGQRLFYFGGQAIIEIRSHGYITQSIDLTAAAPGKYINVFMPLAPVKLIVESDIPLKSPNWLVDDKWFGSSDRFETMIKPGSYTVKMTSNYTSDITQKVSIVRGEQKSIMLSPQSIEGAITISSLPAGADVYVDGSLVAKTPASISVSGGNYLVEIVRDKYITQREFIEVNNHAPNIERNYRLFVGTNGVTMTLRPKGGKLFVDGRLSKTQKTVQVPKTRSVEVSYQKQGYTTKKIRLSAKDRSATLSLDKAFGKLIIDANIGASAYVDNKLVGTTPVTLKLQALSYEVLVRQDGFLEKRQQVTVKENQTEQATFALVTKKEAFLSKSLTKVTNSLGMTMLRFLPKPFLMGAPRSERGQRADEIQINVGFDRHIYVSTYEVSEAAYALSKGRNSTSKNPARNLSWDDAAQFCNWLSQKEGLPEVYSIKNGAVVSANLTKTGYRLPTEAEWEWLAKSAGKNQPTVFVWGDQYRIQEKKGGNLADIAAKGKASVFLADYSDGFAELAPIGSFPKERSGLYDMSGNVSEWVHDRYSRIPVDLNKRLINYAGPKSMHGEHVIKGSHYLSESWTELRASARQPFRAANETTGFRIARYIY